MAKTTQRRPDRQFVRTIKDPRTGKRLYFYGKTEREVNRKLLEFTRKAELGRTFAEVADEWWGDTYDTLAVQTLKGYKPAYARTLEEFGEDPIDQIQPRDILAFLKKLSYLQFTTKTIANHRIILNQIFSRAVVDGDIQFNPCASVHVPKGAKKSATRDPASSEDEERILTSDHPWLFPVFALLTGLRKGEILALQWRDIDLDANLITVSKSIEHIGKKPNVKEPKTENGYRQVPLLNLLKEKLLLFKEKQKPKSDHFLFSDDGGKTPLYEHRYTRLYKDYCKDVGISCTAHQLRHSYATIAVEEDVNPKDLQNALGHADISTTLDVYAKARKRSAEKVAEKLNAKYSSHVI